MEIGNKYECVGGYADENERKSWVLGIVN